MCPIPKSGKIMQENIIERNKITEKKQEKQNFGLKGSFHPDLNANCNTFFQFYVWFFFLIFLFFIFIEIQ